MDNAMPPDPTPTEDALAEAARVARTRRIVLLSGALTVLVMGGVIALALVHGRESHGAGRTPLPVEMPRDPWPGEDCAPDAAHPAVLHLSVDADGIDLGVLREGVVVTREVTVRNDGEGVLCLQRVDTSCGCVKTRIKDDKRRIQPGEEGVIEVIVDTVGRSGPQHKDVNVYSNDFKHPRVVFPVKANITAPIMVDPTQVNFGRVTAGQESTVTVTLRSTMGPTDWEVTGIHGTERPGVPAIAYTYEVQAVEGAPVPTKQVVIHHPGLDREDIFQDTITIETTHPDRREVRIPAYLVVVKPILAAPPQAVLGFVKAGDTHGTRIRLVPGDPKGSFKALGLEVRGRDGGPLPEDGGPFVVTGPAFEEGMWVVDVAWDGKERPPGVYSGLVVVRTDMERMPEIEIPCFATVQE
jgi:hypothetical protein